MDISEWDKRYIEGYESIARNIHCVNGIFVAYNSNVDAIKHIGPGD
ncbi:MAG: ADP-dependent phosphofructokinase/glucokinase, partial [Methanohalophilus sp.]